MPHGGLALANSLATALEAIVLFIVMRKRLNGIEGNHIMRGVIPSAIAHVGDVNLSFLAGFILGRFQPVDSHPCWRGGRRRSLFGCVVGFACA